MEVLRLQFLVRLLELGQYLLVVCCSVCNNLFVVGMCVGLVCILCVFGIYYRYVRNKR